jgi:microsomal dipeptidase-like Zn-dependent dipeptidase
LQNAIFEIVKNNTPMTANTLKKELHKAIDHIEDASFLKAVYTIVNEKKFEYDLSPDQWQDVERIQKLHKNGKSRDYSWEEVKKYAKSKRTKDHLQDYS